MESSCPSVSKIPHRLDVRLCPQISARLQCTLATVHCCEVLIWNANQGMSSFRKGSLRTSSGNAAANTQSSCLVVSVVAKVSGHMTSCMNIEICLLGPILRCARIRFQPLQQLRACPVCWQVEAPQELMKLDFREATVSVAGLAGERLVSLLSCKLYGTHTINS